MNTTVSHKEIHNWFDGKVIIDEIKEYKDSRGSLVEVWRNDDDRMKDSVMSYWSETAPYVIRGPHQHSSQRDEFISWRSDMVYMLHNPETGETKTFRTDPTKITRVTVSPPIIHSYRNLDNKVSLTGNFPTSLFMGKDKKEKTDETRHEPKLKDTTVYVVLGAGGRLGKSITKVLFDNMGIANHQVIPVYEKFPAYDSIYVQKFVDRIKESAKLTEAGEVVIINCAADTRTKTINTDKKQSKDMVWVNSDFPFLMGERCSRSDVKFIHFSTDYVYQKIKEGNVRGKLSDYTRTKQFYESSLNDVIESNGKMQRNTTVLRVSNLFSVDRNDTVNILYKINEKVKTNTVIDQDPQVKIGITDVDVLSKWVYENMKNGELFKRNGTLPNFYNVVSGSVYNIPDLVKKHFNDYSNIIKVDSDLEYWFDEFANDTKCNVVTIPDSEESIKSYINFFSKK
jgi:dTDP-4-dehydrorhamnose reductase/dTDP-4-dehydrorhamnose 3,5-epimerase-like enzyme